MRDRHPNWYWLVGGTLKIIDGISRLLTLGFWEGLKLEYKFVFWYAGWDCQKRVLDRKNHGK